MPVLSAMTTLRFRKPDGFEVAIPVHVSAEPATRAYYERKGYAFLGRAEDGAAKEDNQVKRGRPRENI
jgi:hypothetical protein